MAADRDVPPAVPASPAEAAPAPTHAAAAATSAPLGPTPALDSASALTIWLAGPAARPLFTPQAQSTDDLTRWRDIVNTRKREEWEISRALLEHVRAQMGAPRHGGASRAAVVAARTDAADGGGDSGDGALLRAGRSGQRVRVESAAPRAPAGVALSLSHSGGHSAAAASRVAVRVGVDVECERPRDLARIGRFAFAARESAQLEALAAADARVERFYILWTLKEAFAKALSLPLLASLRQCTFSEDGGAWRGSVPTANAWLAQTFRPSPTLVLSVVALLPEHISPENFSLSTHEWPTPAASPWRTLATLRSDA